MNNPEQIKALGGIIRSYIPQGWEYTLIVHRECEAVYVSTTVKSTVSEVLGRVVMDLEEK